MADNVVVTAGTGTTVAADEVVDGTLGTVKVQYVKLMDGTLDGSTKAAVGAGGLKVDPTSAVAMNTGARSATTQRVTVATDDNVPVTLTAETTKVIGTVRTASGGIASGSVASGAVASGAYAAGSLAAGAGVDGWDLTQGAIADAAVTAGATGSISAKLRSISRDIALINTALGSTALDLGSGTGGTRTIRTIVDSSQFQPLGATTKSASTSVARATDETLGLTVTQAASSTITRPADTTAYASGDLVANSTTAGSVTNLQFTTLARISGGSGVIVGAQIQKSTNTTTNAAFRLHLFNTAPTYTSAGDNSAMTTVVVASAKGYLGYIDVSAMVGFSDVAWGSGAPDNSRGGIPYVATAQIIYGLLEARGAYTPGNAEVFTITLDALQD